LDRLSLTIACWSKTQLQDKGESSHEAIVYFFPQQSPLLSEEQRQPALYARRSQARLEKRKPVNLIAVLDISSSMYGQKIEFVRKSTLKLIEHLGEGDRLGVITFNGGITTVFEPTLMKADAKDSYRQQVSQICSGGLG